MEGQGAEEELRSLRTWFLETPDIRRHAKISWETPAPEPGGMSGGAVEILQLITDNVWQATTFALAYTSWRATRRNTPRVTIEHNGNTLVIEGHDEESAQRIARALTRE
ncbi:effector-associated constant component EACC1 [Streptomyces sp. AK02-01A]|uniref:effector-associated constant component EACC1 n=1 Tax=Streptomyces sp. AK02-01A TaxID=3028648 RepID=UPI00299FC9A8|nr:hypothetical protein [Streptomyces sp. AK02-01A]MDX3851764.1 hypothetical protein [Streptomyces sp. AK02-01A]